MEGNIITIDYELSSWKHMNEDSKKSFSMFSNSGCNDILKINLFNFIFDKGMGSSTVGQPCIMFRGRRIFIHDELFDLDYMTPLGKTNRELMANGNAPFGIDGKRINLHHINQEPDGNLEKVLQTVHQKNTNELHPYLNRPSRINRKEFQEFRLVYWKYRLARYVEDKE